MKSEATTPLLPLKAAPIVSPPLHPMPMRETKAAVSARTVTPMSPHRQLERNTEMKRLMTDAALPETAMQ